MDQATYENGKSINNTQSATHNAFNFCVSEIKKKTTTRTKMVAGEEKRKTLITGSNKYFRRKIDLIAVV